jgi:hypothetical protein
MDTATFPALFASEAIDFESPAGISGVSSFGYGGTNARGDIWGRCIRGPRLVTEINTHQVYEKRAPYFNRVYNNGTPGPHSKDKVCIAGSWDGFSKMEVMTCSEVGTYTARVALGDVCREQFRLFVNGDEEGMVIHPVVKNAGPEAEVVGPVVMDSDVRGLRWLIDGSEDGAVTGQIYEITFTWSFSWERGEAMAVAWTMTDSVTDEPPYRHCYSIVGTWTSWNFVQMTKSAEDDDSFVHLVRVGRASHGDSEEFFLARDNDWSQIIHPALPRTRKTSVPIRGPDGNIGTPSEPDCKTWLLRAQQAMEVLAIQLKVADGLIELAISSETRGIKTWDNRDKDWPIYFITGTMNNWRFNAMVLDLEAKGIFRCRLAIGAGGEVEFGIVMEKDWEKQLYPEVAQASQGEAMTCGPDGRGQGLFWLLTGDPGDVYEVILDSRAKDRYSMVTWERVELQVQALAGERDQEWKQSATDSGVKFWWKRDADGEMQTVFEDPYA